jgi:hypothetical protein
MKLAIRVTLIASLCLTVVGFVAQSATTAPSQEVGGLSMDTVKHLDSFQAIEFRRYNTAEGQRPHFATYFDAFFPEAFEQLGAIAFGSFFERGSSTHFTWIRGFHTIADRAIANAAFYYGPVWKEHNATVNAILPDSDNVMLLRPLDPEHGVLVLPSVDPVIEAQGAQGVVISEIFSVKKGSEDAFAKQAAPVFARYRAAGVQEAGILVSLPVANNFPQLPIRSDGPFLVWIGIVKNNQALEELFNPLVASANKTLTGTGLLRAAPELVILDPTKRSRLRWLPTWRQS